MSDSEITSKVEDSESELVVLRRENERLSRSLKEWKDDALEMQRYLNNQGVSTRFHHKYDKP